MVYYAGSLFVGTSYILWQFTALGLLAPGLAETILLPTFVLNLIIELILCPVLIKSISPKLKSVGLYYGSFLDGEAKLEYET